MANKTQSSRLTNILTAKDVRFFNALYDRFVRWLISIGYFIFILFVYTR